MACVGYLNDLAVFAGWSSPYHHRTTIQPAALTTTTTHHAAHPFAQYILQSPHPYRDSLQSPRRVRSTLVLAPRRHDPSVLPCCSYSSSRLCRFPEDCQCHPHAVVSAHAHPHDRCQLY